MGKVLGTQSHPTYRSASTHCVSNPNSIEGSPNILFQTHTHSSMHLTFNMAYHPIVTHGMRPYHTSNQFMHYIQRHQTSNKVVASRIITCIFIMTFKQACLITQAWRPNIQSYYPFKLDACSYLYAWLTFLHHNTYSLMHLHVLYMFMLLFKTNKP